MLAEAGRSWIQRVLAPLAARLPGVDPNVLTVVGLCIAIAAGFALSRSGGDPAWFLVAAGLCVVYGVVDALDGVVARTHGKVSALGDFLDHTFDRLSALAAFGGLALSGHGDARIILVVMLGTLWHGFLGTQLQASFGRRAYQGLGVGESLLAGLVYTLVAWWMRSQGMPFHFREPLTGVTLSVTDAFALASLPLIAVATVQRIALAVRLSREGEGGGDRRTSS